MKTETTIRRAREAVGLILDGAIRHLESDYGPDEPTDRLPMIADLFNTVHLELDNWEIVSPYRQMDNLVAEMGAALDPASPISSEVREYIRQMLAQHDLLP